MDSGLRLNNCATDSGISLRLNVTKSDFKKFINDLISLENIDVYLKKLKTTRSSL